MIYCRRKEAVP